MGKPKCCAWLAYRVSGLELAQTGVNFLVVAVIDGSGRDPRVEVTLEVFKKHWYFNDEILAGALLGMDLRTIN